MPVRTGVPAAPLGVGDAGTLDELFEVWTWQQLGLHDKPVGLLNRGGYWEPLLAGLTSSTAETGRASLPCGTGLANLIGPSWTDMRVETAALVELPDRAAVAAMLSGAPKLGPGA